MVDGALGLIKNIQVKDTDSIYDVVEKRFGRDMAKYMVDSVTRGIFATSARNLCIDNALPAISPLKSGRMVSNIWSVIREERNRYPEMLPYKPHHVKKAEQAGWKAWNLESGLESLIEKMADKCVQNGVAMKCEASIDRITKSDGNFIVNDEVHNQLVSAISAPNLTRILSDDFNPELLENLAQYRETNLFVYLVELEEHELPREIGFGVLTPSCEEPELLGITYDSCVFPEHDKHGSRYTIMSLGELDPQQTLKRTLGIESNIRYF